MIDLRTPENMQLDEVVSEDELVPADDTIIGKAFIASLAIFAVIGLAIGGMYLILSRPEPPVSHKPAAFVPPKSIDVPATPPTVKFTDITIESGIDFLHANGATGDKLLPETMGGGCAFLDFDNDNDQDILLINSSNWPDSPRTTLVEDPPWRAPSPPTHALYRNDGHGKFANVTKGSGLDISFYGMGVACGDYNRDGFVDVFISAVGPNHLFRNEGNGKFTDVTNQADIAGADDSWSTSCGFFDYDNDGALDLFVCNYVKWSRQIDFAINYTLTGIGRAYGPPNNFEGAQSYLYHNNSDGTFTDVSESAGIHVNTVLGKPMGKALGLVFADVDRDGFMDIFVANDTVQRFFFHNQGDGTFKERGAEFGLAFDRAGNATGAMGVDAAQYRNDHNLGIAIGNFANEMSSLLVTQGNSTLFSDEAITEGIGAPTRLLLKFGTFFFDCDLDGRLDLLHANGHIEDQINIVQPSQQYRQSAQLFWNAGPDAKACYVEVPHDSLGDLSHPIVGRGAAHADIDGDGDLDVLLTQVGGRPVLLRNELNGDSNTMHHWLRVKLRGTGASNRDAIGATVELSAGGVTQTRMISPSRSYLTQVELPATFGLADAEQIDSIRITWPDRSRQDIQDVKTNRLIVIDQAESTTSAGGGSRTHTPLRGTGF